MMLEKRVQENLKVLVISKNEIKHENDARERECLCVSGKKEKCIIIV